MKIIIKNLKNECLETISFENLENIHELFKKFFLLKGPLEAKIFAINELISSHHLSIFKKNFDKIDISSLCLYSNNRDTILAGKSLKIESIFIKEKEAKNKLLLLNSEEKEDILR